MKDTTQVSSMDEYDHRQDSLLMMLRAHVANLYSLDTTAAQSFSLGIVNYFRRATLAVEHSSQDV
jgi:hypothetical protein